jgi:citrate lyase subunit beta/citryl-CoA lyase
MEIREHELPDGVAWLFCPADRPERFAKAAAVADVVILDLEDGVAPGSRDAARAALASHPLDPARTVVRINAIGTTDHEADLRAVRATGYRSVMLAKAEDPAQVAALAPLEVIALCETPAGVLGAHEIALADNVVGVMWGAEDLLASLGGGASRNAAGRFRNVALHAQSAVLLAAATAGKPAIDAVYLDIGDADGLRAETEEAVGCGFCAKACIHPSQVAVVRDVYRPSDEELAFARRVIEAAAAHEHGVFALDGRMIDEPILRQARRVLSRRP